MPKFEFEYDLTLSYRRKVSACGFNREGALLIADENAVKLSDAFLARGIKVVNSELHEGYDEDDGDYEDEEEEEEYYKIDYL